MFCAEAACVRAMPARAIRIAGVPRNSAKARRRFNAKNKWAREELVAMGKLLLNVSRADYAVAESCRTQQRWPYGLSVKMDAGRGDHPLLLARGS
jgi:hypothetical protein